MKKVNYLLKISILVLAFILCIGASVNAADGTLEFFETQEIEIQSTTETYTTGTVLTILLKRDENVEITDPAEVMIQFGNGPEIELTCDTQPGNVKELQYTYTIKSSDVGELKILRQQQTTQDGNSSTSLDNITPSKTVIANSGSSGDDQTGDEENPDIEWTDFSNATFEWSSYTETDHRSPNLNVKGVNLTNSYYFYMSHNANDTPDLSQLGEDLNYWKLISSDGQISYVHLTSYLETNGDLYLWIAEVQGAEKKIVLNAKKIERLEQVPLTKRLVGYFNSEGATVFCYEPYTSTDRKINIKIGKMTDNTILRNIKNNASNAMNSLLNYAKNADAIYEQNDISFGANVQIPDSVTFTDDAYYFAYIELEDENGQYYPVEDVELYQASISPIGWTLINHTDRDFVYNIDDDINNDNNNNQNDNTIAPGTIPQTGIYSIIVTMIGILVVVAIFVAYRTTKYKDIK